MNSQDLMERAEILQRIEAIEAWINARVQMEQQAMQEQQAREEQMQRDLEAAKQRERVARARPQIQQPRQQLQMPQQQGQQTQQFVPRPNVPTPNEVAIKQAQRQAGNIYTPTTPDNPEDYEYGDLTPEDENPADNAANVPQNLPPLNAESANDKPKPAKPPVRVLWNRK